MSLFTSLYNHPTELFPSPRGPNMIKAGYLSFQYNASTHCHSSGYLSTAKHTCTQFIKQGTFSKRIPRSVNLKITKTKNSSLLAEKIAITTLKMRYWQKTSYSRWLAGHWLSWIGPSSGVLAYRQILNRPGFASGKWVMETFLGDFILSVEFSGKDLTATTRVEN